MPPSRRLIGPSVLLSMSLPFGSLFRNQRSSRRELFVLYFRLLNFFVNCLELHVALRKDALA